MEEKFANAAYSNFQDLDSIVNEYFQYELTEFPSPFTNGRKMYHSKKSDLLNKFRQSQGAVTELTVSDRSAIVFDLYVFINALAGRKSLKAKTIDKVCYKNVYKEISNQYKECVRDDIVTDSYSDGINLKEMTQHRRAETLGSMWSSKTILHFQSTLPVISLGGQRTSVNFINICLS